MIKAIFFDIDGTLLSHRTKQIPSSTIEALKKLKEKDIYIFIATGRHISEMRNLPTNDFKFDGYITLNGGYCYNMKEVIYANEINKQDIINIIDFIDQQPFPCMFIEDNQMYINYNNKTVEIVQKSTSTPLPNLDNIKRGLTHPVYMVVPYDITVYKEKEILDCMPHCKHTRWHDLAIDIIPASGGKQAGIAEVLKYYGINQDETMAFGDGHNDIDMFEFVNLAIAMGNASDEVKKAADDITDDIDEDGIYNALIKYNII